VNVVVVVAQRLQCSPSVGDSETSPRF
jgi:hypothetical protein